jgi:hypothetical protein
MTKEDAINNSQNSFLRSNLDKKNEMNSTEYGKILGSASVVRLTKDYIKETEWLDNYIKNKGGKGFNGYLPEISEFFAGFKSRFGVELSEKDKLALTARLTGMRNVVDKLQMISGAAVSEPEYQRIYDLVSGQKLGLKERLNLLRSESKRMDDSFSALLGVSQVNTGTKWAEYAPKISKTLGDYANQFEELRTTQQQPSMSGKSSGRVDSVDQMPISKLDQRVQNAVMSKPENKPFKFTIGGKTQKVVRVGNTIKVVE